MKRGRPISILSRNQYASALLSLRLSPELLVLANIPPRTGDPKLDRRVTDQQYDTSSPRPLHPHGHWLWELALAPFNDDEQLGDNGGEEEPRVLAHAHGAAADRTC